MAADRRFHGRASGLKHCECACPPPSGPNTGAGFRKAATNAGHPAAAVNLGNLLADAGRAEETEQAYRQALDAGRPDAAVDLGVLLAELGGTDGVWRQPDYNPYLHPGPQR
ncbi:hypothetical protein [Streptomyces sp. NPDC005303]|uniref:hypothetical protein n=1 Tax=Streptomyces sp. NPDC005303 TaxID=3155713 RepID=UPI0033A2F50E